MHEPFPRNPQFKPRSHQEAAPAAVFDAWRRGVRWPLLQIATGGGKSMAIGEICRQILNRAPSTRIGVITLTKELVRQDEADMKFVCPNLPIGVVMAGLNRREYKKQVVVGSVQTLYRNLDKTGGFHVIVIDEAHLTPLRDDEKSMFYKLFTENAKVIPKFEVIGLTATDWRGNKPITGWEKCWFGETVFRFGIGEAVKAGYLVPPVTIDSKVKIDTSRLKVSTSTGEYTDKSLAEVADDDRVNIPAVQQTIEHLNNGRHSAAVFAASIEHAEKVARMFCEAGMEARSVHGKMKAADRDKTLQDFASGKYRVIVSCQVLLIGWDHKPLDLITVLRPIRSTAAHVQLIGRGMRVSEATGKEDCLVLDFTDNSVEHGPLDLIKAPAPPALRVDRDEIGKIKECPPEAGGCAELIPANARLCPHCGFEFSEANPTGLPELNQEAARVALLSTQKAPPRLFPVTGWMKSRHTKPNAPDSFRIDYYWETKIVATEWLLFNRMGRPREEAARRWHALCGEYPSPTSVEDALLRKHELKMPTVLKCRREGKYEKVIGHDYRDYGDGHAA